MKIEQSLKPTVTRVTPFAAKANPAPRYGGLVPPLESTPGGNIMYSKTVLAVAVICIIAVIACTEEVEPVGPYMQTFLVKDSVEYAFEVNGNVFSSLDTVKMFFLVTNLSNETVHFGSYIKCYACGFYVRYGRLDIWNSCRIPPPCGVSRDSLL